MVQNGTQSDHLDRLGDPGAEIVQNGTQSDHLDRLGDPGGEMVQNGTKSYHLDHLGDPLRRFLWGGGFQAGLTNPPKVLGLPRIF